MFLRACALASRVNVPTPQASLSFAGLNRPSASGTAECAAVATDGRRREEGRRGRRMGERFWPRPTTGFTP